MIPDRPVLRWHGGKWLLAPKIIEHFPPHKVYTEVFGGAASVLMQKPRSYAEIYNDLDEDVVNLFRVLRDQSLARELRRVLEFTPFARVEFYYAYKSEEEMVERARRLIIRSFMGFGSNACNHKKHTGFRANSNRSGTTPAHDWANYPACMDAMIERLRGVIIECRPALEILQQHDGPETLHYADPPYIHATRKKGQQKNYLHEMRDADHYKLLEVLKKLKGMVIVSGYFSEIYDEELGGWERWKIESLADGARPRTEFLWINPAAWEANLTLFFNPSVHKIATTVTRMR